VGCRRLCPLLAEPPHQGHHRLVATRRPEGVDQALTVTCSFQVETDDLCVLITEQVLHQLTGGDITLRASDRQDTSTDPQTRIELSLIGTDDARLRALFDGLADGGTVRAKLEKQFWGDVFGAVTDKYGIGWQINIGTAGA